GGATLSGYFAFPRQEVARPAPGLAAEPAVARVGERGQGEMVAVQFTLTNHYAEPVEIYSVTTGCSCQTPVVSRKHIAPGQESVINLSWSSGRMRGGVTESLWVFHSIPGQPAEGGGRMQLQIEGEVTPDIHITPERVQFTAGQPKVQRVSLGPGRLSSFSVKEVYANSPALSAKYLPGESLVEITYTPQCHLDSGAEMNVAMSTSSQQTPS